MRPRCNTHIYYISTIIRNMLDSALVENLGPSIVTTVPFGDMITSVLLRCVSASFSALREWLSHCNMPCDTWFKMVMKCIDPFLCKVKKLSGILSGPAYFSLRLPHAVVARILVQRSVAGHKCLHGYLHEWVWQNDPECLDRIYTSLSPIVPYKKEELGAP